ncbi:DUF4824 family protein [Pseudomonas sp. Gutcm_11s]|uniref:DUF4824 family protein n=1 Tax=Pseudomonas sp. Gutcm_11s TaxID=3026088 RepID=UPI00235FD309|nr:DUF4824 family protein [Pseudomonas sp. Gutcm_11s]MDD0842040.1 DUF4824 family protein [Pseudomonas sp. Gutcm_11s]
MIAIKPRHGLLAGLGLILLSNAVALAGVWYNRQGEPESRLLLSQRELHRDWDGPRKENSGLSMRLDWRMPVHPKADKNHCYSDRGLTKAQLQAVGLPSSGPEPRQDTRAAWAILELDGPLYQQSLQQAEQHLQQASAKLQELPGDKERQEQEKAASKALADERSKESRLFLADVGLEAAALRQRYPDRDRYMLLRGTVRVWRRCYNETDTSLSGTFDPSNASINVPHTWRQALAERLPTYYNDADQPFSAEISFGQRLEPWLSDVRITDKTSNRDDENGAPR